MVKEGVTIRLYTKGIKTMASASSCGPTRSASSPTPSSGLVTGGLAALLLNLILPERSRVQD